MDFEFDFRLHADPSRLVGTQYFELALGAYKGAHRLPGSRFINEYTFSLIEGIFEEHVPKYDHFGCVEVPRSQWKLILGDLATLCMALAQARETARVALPYGGTLRVRSSFDHNLAANQRQLASLLFALEQWLSETLTLNEVVSVLGL
ncbi:MAG TPA: hypothetical protein VIX59_15755 [Candidatus Binataceae bacterium]